MREGLGWQALCPVRGFTACHPRNSKRDSSVRGGISAVGARHPVHGGSRRQRPGAGERLARARVAQRGHVEGGEGADVRPRGVRRVENLERGRELRRWLERGVGFLEPSETPMEAFPVPGAVADSGHMGAKETHPAPPTGAL